MIDTIARQQTLPGPRAALRPLRIGIDAHGVGGHSLGFGNETYFKNLIASLLAIDEVNEYHIFTNHPEAMDQPLAGRRNAKPVSLFPHTQWVQRPVSIPLYANNAGLDIVHFPFIRPPFVRARCVVTVHDIFYELYPDYFRTIDRWRMQWLVPRNCAKADLVFTVSEHAKMQIHEIYGTPLDKIVVTYNAADQFKNGVPAAVASHHFDLPEKFILYIGLIQPKKNLARLVQAFDRVKSRLDIPHHLVLAGGWGWGNDELLRVLEKLQHRDQIHFIGYLNEHQIRAVLPRAEMFVFPSVFESFGIPPLEAQQFRVPVLISNSTCFPEVFGDSALFCDPLDVESIARGMERIAMERNLRDDLIRRGADWSKRYTWEKSARIALAAYQHLGGRT